MITFFGIFIIATILYIIFRLQWLMVLFNEEHRKLPFIPYAMPITTIEKAYRAIDFQSRMDYSDLEVMQSIGLYRPFDYFSTERIVRDNNHLNHLIEKECIELTRQMIKEGCIEITHLSGEEHNNPYRNTILFKVRVYKPEN